MLFPNLQRCAHLDEISTFTKHWPRQKIDETLDLGKESRLLPPYPLSEILPNMTTPPNTKTKQQTLRHSARGPQRSLVCESKLPAHRLSPLNCPSDLPRPHGSRDPKTRAASRRSGDNR